MGKKDVNEVNLKVTFRVTYEFESEEDLEKLMTALDATMKSDQTKDLFFEGAGGVGQLLSVTPKMEVGKVVCGDAGWEAGVGTPGAEQVVQVQIVGLGAGESEDGGVICKLLGLRNSSTDGAATDREYIYEASKPPEWWGKLKVGALVDVTYRRFGTTRRLLWVKALKMFGDEEKALLADELDDDIGPGFPKDNPDDDSDSMWGH